MPLRKYVEIMKPGIIFGNAIPVISGYILASRGDIRWGLFAYTLVGSALGIASACVFNNVIDRKADARMARTKGRAIVTGQIGVPAALVFGSLLGLAGSAILLLYVNFVAAAAGAVGFFFYIVMYSIWWKPRAPIGTAMGSVSGAMPPVVGYVAFTGRIDAGALILFAILVTWQMPHFFAIAIRRKNEYAAAGFPVLPVVRGVKATKIQMLFYIIAFNIAAPLLTVFGYCGVTYLGMAVALGLTWLVLCLKGFWVPEGTREEIDWARGMFKFSLIVMIVLFLAIGLTTLYTLP